MYRWVYVGMYNVFGRVLVFGFAVDVAKSAVVIFYDHGGIL